MKRLIFALAFISVFSSSFAQKTALELLKSKINATITTEIPKYSDFGPAHYLSKVVIMDVTEKDNKFVVDGEFTFTYKWDFQTSNDEEIIKTFKYQAIVKQILDDFSVIKVIYQDPKDKAWYRLFPANDF